MEPTKHPGGRPSKFTPELCESIIKSISARVPYELAAESNGITYICLLYWMREGREDLSAGRDTEKAKFFKDIKQVEANRIAQHLENIDNGADKWQSQAWILERRWHKHFSPNAAVRDVNERLDQMEIDQGLKKEMKNAIEKVD